MTTPDLALHRELATAAGAGTGFCVAGIGASAGGLEAICEFFAAMPADSGIAFVVIQHLYPSQQSMAAEIIAKHTSIIAQPAKEGMRVEPNHIYTIPANTYPSLRDGRLHLDEPKNKVGPRLPIDHFFVSLGNDQHERAIGIVLSGSGTDGSLGVKWIEANGGIVFAQSPDSAQFDSMPRSAIATGLVHKVLPVADMPAALVAYARHDYVREALDAGVKEAIHGLEEILSILWRRCGNDFRGYRRHTLIRRIRRRMGLHSTNSFADYAALLNSEADEVNALFKDLLIGVTEFFRDVNAWQALKTLVIAPLVDAKQAGETIRVWVPGCSTGEEAYTIAILVLEQLREAEKRCQLLVFATDTSEDALQLGRLGNYPSGICTQITDDVLRRYFVESTGNQHYQVGKTLRDAVVFGHQNLLNDPPFSKVDLICCRNLLIHLESDVQRKIIALFRFSLLPGGCLFLGSSESLSKYSDVFSPISKKWRIYRPIGTNAPGYVHLPLYRFGRPLAVPQLPAPPAEEKFALAPSQLARITQQLLLAKFSPAAVLVNACLETLYFSGPIENYLQMPPGVPSQDLLAQAREGLRLRLRNALRQAISSGATVVVDDARVRRNKAFHPVRLSVVPTKNVGTLLYLIVFEDLMSPAAADGVGADSALVRQLEADLSGTREELQYSVERLESSNEELKVSHEEVVSINEELQSINEELESSKEEMQSLNEELMTVNQQLQVKVADLETSNSDITNLLASSQIATLCLDRENRIRWFSPSMKTISNIIVGDVGRPISDFSAGGLGGNLIEDAANVLESLVPVQRELMSPDERWFLRRVVPYRGDKDHIGGVVITYVDISEAKQDSEAAAAAQRAMAASLEDRVRQRTAQLRMLTAELALTEERERRVLARDLHDDLGQVLAIVKIKLTSLEESERRGALKAPLQEIETLIDQANRSARSLMLQLNPPILQTLGLLPALEWLGEEMDRSYGLVVHIDNEGEVPALEEPARTTIFRAIRELLINVAKHAGTNVAQINCHQTANCQLSISVTDQGLGFDYQQALSNPAKDSGFGLISVGERIEFIGGEMTVDTMPGYGTTITIVFPADKSV